ncbi:hypothetical protein L6452_05616 [Arctium lappa]|uniref:Uncharacterized protein n=1 Tax=Arctium lappa TaxID=4217 RepID=A0ACB9EGM1_ARCLA|nr:hypothetical protein L6452_05616 [Arctium lappa]
MFVSEYLDHWKRFVNDLSLVKSVVYCKLKEAIAHGCRVSTETVDGKPYLYKAKEALARKLQRAGKLIAAV